MKHIILRNDLIHAEFSKSTGNLTFLATDDSCSNLISESFCQYTLDGTCCSDAESPEPRNSRVKIIEAANSLTAIIADDNVETTKIFSLIENSPLLNVRVTIKGMKDGIKLVSPILPGIRFNDDFNDAFEDEEDLYFDGAELGDGVELPCWRVFFRNGHNEGLILATRSKYEMSHMKIYDCGFDVAPHIMPCYDTNMLLHRIPLTLNKNNEYSVSFEIGSWARDDHEEILSAACLGDPRKCDSRALTGGKPSELSGTVFKIAEICDKRLFNDAYSDDKWLKTRMPCSLSGEVLCANAGTIPPPITFTPSLDEGVYRIHVGIANGNGVTLRIGDTGSPIYRAAPGSMISGKSDIDPASPEFLENYKNLKITPFHLYLSGKQKAEEIFVTCAELTGQTLELTRYPDSFTATVIDYIRFEKLSERESREWREKSTLKPIIKQSGFVDTPDLCLRLDGTDPDPEVYISNIHEHANCGINKIFWRIDGQCSDYPSKINTMRYISAKTHGVYNPRSKSYGKILKKVDLLKLAVKTAREHDVKLYGWMRFNNYSGNVQSDFFKNNPQFHEEFEDTMRAARFCLAHPEVRKHKIDILIEACKYGLDGINLGFLRHPPILMYAPILVEGYKNEYGEPPPRIEDHEDCLHKETLPRDGSEYLKWYGYRARFMTMFMKELKEALAVNGLKNVKTSIWVRPNHCLFDGINLPVWLEKGLIDEVVVQNLLMGQFENVYRVSPEWKRMVQKHVPLIYGLWYQDSNVNLESYKKVVKEGYDGICTYESNEAVLESKFIEIFQNLRGEVL